MCRNITELRGLEPPATTEEIAGASTQQEEPAITQDVRADDPLQRTGTQVQPPTDGGQRDTHHGDVKTIEEEGPTENDQKDPDGTGPTGLGGHGRRVLYWHEKKYMRVHLMFMQLMHSR